MFDPLATEAQRQLSGFFDNDKKLSKFTKDEMELLLPLPIPWLGT